MGISGSGEVGIGISPNTNGQLFVSTTTKLYGIASLNTSNNGYGIYGQVGPSSATGTVYGVAGVANSSAATNNIGLSGQALSGTNNYAIQLQDGSEGTGKVLVSQTTDGKAKWSTKLTGNYEITGSLSVTSVGNNSGSFVTLNGNNTLNSRTAAQTRVDINYYGLTYAMQNGYY
jgi:hypothetical protein